jgi:hypothetical protein
MTVILRICFKCGRDNIEFRSNNKATCKDCWREYMRAWWKANPEKRKEADDRKVKSKAYRARIHSPEYLAKARNKAKLSRQNTNKEDLKIKDRRTYLKQNYNLSESDYQILFDNQYGCCVICKQPPQVKNLCVDHDHKTGVIRGLLCNSCNGALGLFEESLELLEKAARYLEMYL